MDINNIIKYNKSCDKLIDDDKSLGVLLIETMSVFGDLSDSVLKYKTDTKNKDFLVEQLVEFQIKISMLYVKMKKRNTLISNRSAMTMLSNNYSNINMGYNNMDSIWIFFKLLSNIGKISDTYHIRTSSTDDQFRMKNLMLVQAYLLSYFNKIEKENKDVNSKKYDELFYNSIGSEYKTISQDSTVDAKPSNVNVSSKVEVSTEKPPIPSPKVENTPKVEVSTEKPPLPSPDVLNEIIGKMIPQNDNIKVEKS